MDFEPPEEPWGTGYILSGALNAEASVRVGGHKPDVQVASLPGKGLGWKRGPARSPGML